MEVVLENISFKDLDNNFILRNINCKFEKGKITSLIGPTGSGKTTLIKLVNYLYKPSEGIIKINDTILNNDNIKDYRKKIGYMFQFPERQFFNKTIKEELELNIDTYNYRVTEKQKRIEESLKMVGLDKSCLNNSPFSLSNGDKRKLALAYILIYNPKIILLDEPTIGLDSNSKKEFIKLIKLLKNRYKKTIIIISHDIDLIHKISDYIYVLNQGKIVFEGNKYEVFKEAKLLKEYNILQPKLCLFSDKVYKKKGIKLGYRDEINDLIKDIYRNVY